MKLHLDALYARSDLICKDTRDQWPTSLRQILTIHIVQVNLRERSWVTIWAKISFLCQLLPAAAYNYKYAL